MMHVAKLHLFSLIVAFGCLGSTHARVQAEHDELPDDPMQSGVSLIAMQFTEDPLADRDPMDMIRNGELGLATIRISPTSFAANGAKDGNYVDVHGEFCAFDLASNKKNPARYPTAHHIMSESEHCGEHAYSLPLRDVVEALRDHDASSLGSGMKSLPVSGLLFHQGYAGAGLVSNALSTFDSALVVSEHPALRDAMNACDTIRNRYKIDDCSANMQQKLVQDVVSLLSRTPADSPVEHLYLKLTSEAAAYLPSLRSLYPDATWTFVYRQADHALAKATQGKRVRSCAKAKRNPTSALAAKSAQINEDLEKLSHHEVCAVHLSSLMDAAFEEHATSGTGILISYDDDILAGGANFFVDTILPYLGLQQEIQAHPRLVRNSVALILSNKSNASGRQGGEDSSWNGENVEVSEVVGTASRTYMTDSMNSILRMRQ